MKVIDELNWALCRLIHPQKGLVWDLNGLNRALDGLIWALYGLIWALNGLN